MKEERIKEILQKHFDERKAELGMVSYNFKSRAFAVAGIDLVYNYMQDVLADLEAVDEITDDQLKAADELFGSSSIKPTKEG